MSGGTPGPVLNVPDATGLKCCTCAAQGETCKCSAAASLLCIQKGGFPSFCGWAEFASPSLPPLYYRKRVLSGSFDINCGGPGVCTGDPTTCTQTWTYNGSSQYSVDTCTLNEASTLTETGGCYPAGDGTFPREDVNAGDINSIPGLTWAINDVYDQVSHTLVNPSPGNCVTSGSGFTACILGTSNCTCILDPQSLDTPAQAITRFEAANPGGWSAPTDCNGACSFILPWGAGERVFAYNHAKVQATVISPIPGHIYRIQIFLIERPAAGGAAAPFAEIDVTVQCPPSGPCISGYQDIPYGGDGFEICASSATVTDIT